MNQNLINDDVLQNLANSLKYTLENCNDVKSAGVLWGYMLALKDVGAITQEESSLWMTLLDLSLQLFTEEEFTAERVKEIIDCPSPIEVMNIWKKLRGFRS